ncbi:MAG: addiction module protein [Gemmatimonadaceae bacterium]
MASDPTFDYSHLTVAERLWWAEELWDSIASDADAEAMPLTDDERALIDERLADSNARPAVGRPWGDVRAGILGTHRR